MCNQSTSTELEFKLLEASIEGPNFFCYHRAGLAPSITSDQLKEKFEEARLRSCQKIEPSQINGVSFRARLKEIHGLRVENIQQGIYP